MATTRSVPVRTCIGCRTARPKDELVRIAATPNRGVCVDPSGHLPGRGAYVCPDPGCYAQLRRRSGTMLRRALRTDDAAGTEAALDALATMAVHPEVRDRTVRSENA